MPCESAVLREWTRGFDVTPIVGGTGAADFRLRRSAGGADHLVGNPFS